MKIIIKTIIGLFILGFFINKSFAQSDRYNWGVKFGYALPNVVFLGDTKSWIDKGKGAEYYVAGIGYKNIYVNWQMRYFNDLIGKKSISFNNYQFNENFNFRNVYSNLFISYEKELFYRLFIEPQLGWTKCSIMTPDASETFETLSGLLVSANVIKYFKIMDDGYIGLLFNFGYNHMAFSKINSELGAGQLNYSFGVILRGTH